MMIIERIKQWGWIKTALAALGMIAVVLAGAKATSRKNSAAKKEERRQQYLAEGSSTALKKARKLKESAQTDIDKAVEARKNMDAGLEKVGEVNEDLDDIMHHFNSKRVLDKQGGPAA